MMLTKRNILSVLLVFLFHAVNSQQNGKESGHKYEFGISYLPSNSYRTLRYSKSQEFLETFRNSNEIPKYSFSLGLLAQRRLNKNSAVQLAVSFSNPGYKTKETSVIWESSNPMYPVFHQVSFSYQYLSVAAGYRFMLNDAKVACYILPGFSLDGFIQRKTTTVIGFSDGKKEKLKSAVHGGYSAGDLSLIAAAGIKYNLSDQYAICVEPTFKHGLISVNPDRDSKEYLYFFGLNMVLIFSPEK